MQANAVRLSSVGALDAGAGACDAQPDTSRISAPMADRQPALSHAALRALRSLDRVNRERNDVIGTGRPGNVFNMGGNLFVQPARIADTSESIVRRPGQAVVHSLNVPADASPCCGARSHPA